MASPNEQIVKKENMKKILLSYMAKCDALDKEGFKCISNGKEVSPKNQFVLDIFAWLKYVSLLDNKIDSSEISFIKDLLGFSSEKVVKENLERAKAYFSSDNMTLPDFYISVIQNEKENNTFISSQNWITSREIIHLYSIISDYLMRVDGNVSEEENCRISNFISEMEKCLDESGISDSVGTSVYDNESEANKSLLYRFSFLGKINCEGLMEPAHIVISGAHRCIYFRVLRDGETYVELYDEYLSYNEYLYNKISWTKALFKAKEQKNNTIQIGKYSIVCPDSATCKLAVKSLNLSDEYFMKGVKLYSPVSISAEEFVTDKEAIQRYDIKIDELSSIGLVAGTLYNVSFKIFDDYMDTLASGCLSKCDYALVQADLCAPMNDLIQNADIGAIRIKNPRVGEKLGKCKFCNQNIIFNHFQNGNTVYKVVQCENKNCAQYLDGRIVDQNYSFNKSTMAANWNPDAIHMDFMYLPKIFFDKENAIDVKYKGSSQDIGSLNIILFLDERAHLLGDADSLKLYYCCESHGISCIEFSFSDDKQYYAFGNWVSTILQAANIGYQIKSDYSSLLTYSEKKNTRNQRLTFDEINDEYFYNCGLDGERLELYGKSFVFNNVFIRNDGSSSNIKYLLKVNSNDKQYKYIRVNGYDKFNQTEFINFPAKLNKNDFTDGELKIDGRTISFSNVPAMTYNMFLYLVKKVIEKKTTQKNANFETDSDDFQNAFNDLNQLIGLNEVKDQISKLINFAKTQKLRAESGLKELQVTNHMVFTGNPGTGKTTVARLIGRLYKSIGIIETDNVVEVSRQDLVAAYVGQTALKTQEVVESALDGILFIDEAYTLSSQEDKSRVDFGAEAIDTLLKLMEDYRDRLVVIVAGYKEEMSSFINSNPGLKSRFKNYINFEDYSAIELYQIFESICKSNEMIYSSDVKNGLMRHFEKMYRQRGPHFGNGRDVRNFFEESIMKQNMRISNTPKPSKEDLQTFIADDFGFTNEVDLLNGSLAELESMIGLNRVKQSVEELVAQIKLQKRREEAGVSSTKGSLHMVFTGNPGTGKTTVARLIAKIFYSLGLLSEGHLVEADRAKLVAGYTGQTAIKTKQVIQSAIGGVLFIDEAYTLLPKGTEADFGKEAIDTLLKEMEDNRESLVVIVAGYKDEMDDFIHSNPGLSSRFNQYIEFEDYTSEEMMLIFERLCKSEHYILKEDARDYVDKYFSSVDNRTFGNARGVRNFFERIKRIQAVRLSKDEAADIFELNSQDVDKAINQ